MPFLLALQPAPLDSRCRPPCTAQALIFYKSFKAGVLVGVEQGQGFVIARSGWRAGLLDC
jgi:hypothetical protein